MTAVMPSSTDPRWSDFALVSTLAAGLDVADPVIVLTPPDGDDRWRLRCTCGLTRAECAAWETHYMEFRRQRYAELGIPYRLWRCGRCGEPVGDRPVQIDGLRYCNPVHAAPDIIFVRYCPCGALEGECGCRERVAQAASAPVLVVAVR
jgi:hypothetical protein